MSRVEVDAWRTSKVTHPSVRELPEQELMTAYLVYDDAGAFSELYRRFAPGLLAYARRRVRAPELAADLVQQTFLNAHLARGRFLLGSPLRPWLTRILTNLVRDQLRKRRSYQLTDLDVGELPAPDSAPLPERNEAIRRTRDALSKLRAPQRAVVELHWLEERSFSEVALTLGEQVSTVKVRAHRAYKELRHNLCARDAG